MGSLSSKNRGVKYLLYVIDVFKPNQMCKRKPNKLRVDERREFYNSPMQKLLDLNDILV